MATQMQLARQGIITEAMKIVAQQENVAPEFVREGVAKGTIAICSNVNHKNLVPRGVGDGLSVKVNANIGTSDSLSDIASELLKLQVVLVVDLHALEAVDLLDFVYEILLEFLRAGHLEDFLRDDGMESL